MFTIYPGTVNKSFISIKGYNRYDNTMGEFVYPHKKFHWDDVKENIIPFMKVLKSEYTINRIHFTLNNGSSSDTIIRGKQITSLIKDEFIVSDKSDIHIITLDVNKR